MLPICRYNIAVILFLQADETGQFGYGNQDDHLKVQSRMPGAAGDGSWADGGTSGIRTTSRMYTDSDGTLITEVSFSFSSNSFLPSCSETCSFTLSS